jgi:broad specificity phosphatase PhoE
MKTRVPGLLKNRRCSLLWVVGLLVFGPLGAGPSLADDLAKAVAQSGVIVMIRHAETEPGFGDPPEFRLSDCSTQRNLSAEGREQSIRLGQWFQRQGLRPSLVRSSQWCRCLETARLAFAGFSRVEAFAPLNSFFQGHGHRDQQLQQARQQAQRLAQQPGPGPEVWVTHQVTITALTGVSPAMGEMVVTQPDRQGQFRVLARGQPGG